jgi:CDP-diacylglycerol--glycerol-3-phosphate 3-phosphatidyltransferase
VNLPNLLTLSRIPFLFAIVGLLYVPLPGARTLAVVFFTIGALTDYFDGYYARKYGIVSNFGKLMDALTDKVFIVGLFIAFLSLDGFLPEWCLPFVLLILTREFLITGLRLVAAAEGTVLAAERSGKLKTVIQIVAASLLLAAEWALTDLSSWLTWLPEGFAQLLNFLGIIAFLLAAVLTISSGTSYLLKYQSLLFKSMPSDKPSSVEVCSTRVEVDS